MAILVTGGTGFIGSHSVVALQQAGEEVIIIDNLSNSSAQVVDNIFRITWKRPIFVQGDVRDAMLLERMFHDYPITGVMHFAAKKAVGESCLDPWSYYEVNIQGLVTLLQAMQTCGVSRIVFSSSAAIYDTTASQSPFDESALTGNCFSPYGTTKRVAEAILRDWVLHLWGQAIALRYFNPIGAHECGLLGEDPLQPPTNLLPVIFQVVQGKRELVEIFGADYPTPDGTCIRDYLHIMDVAQAHVFARQRLMWHTMPIYEVCNLGTGQGTSVLELIAIVERELARKVTYRISNPRMGDVAVVYANPTKAKQVLQRQASYSIAQAVKDGRKFLQRATA